MLSPIEISRVADVQIRQFVHEKPALTYIIFASARKHFDHPDTDMCRPPFKCPLSLSASSPFTVALV